MKREFLEEAPQIVRDYMNYMQNIKGRSEMTVNVYYGDLRIFFRYMKKLKGKVPKEIPYEEIEIGDISVEFIRGITFADINCFMNYCIEERNNKASARSRKTASLNSFFSYLKDKVCLIEENPTDRIDVPRKKKTLPKYLTLEHSMELLNAVDGKYKERDYCILTLFLNCGMRLSELVSIDETDICANTVRIHGKGGKERIVYLNQACNQAIEEYRKVRETENAIDKKAFFLSRLKKRIGKPTVQEMVYKYLKKIGLDSQGYSVHKLRHTAATLMYQYGNVDIMILKEILGHENIDTTQIYTHLSSRQLQDAVNSNPLAKIRKT